MGNRDKGYSAEGRHLDELTGLHNLTGILEHLQEHDDASELKGSGIVYLNFMNFKTFNRRYGFAGGNIFLKGIAGEIKSAFPNELIARTGGDQFVVLVESIDEKEILKRVEEIRQRSRNHSRDLKMRLKVGIYMAKGDESDPVIIMDRAKIACDSIMKVYDRDYSIYDEALDKKNNLRQYVIDNFEKAFKKKYFKVYYQKEVRALTGKVCGYEALARWDDPEMGLISPAVFVEVLESVHLVNRLDICIIDMVCEELHRAIGEGFVVEPVSVNLSQLDFELCDIKAEIDKVREKYDIPTSLLKIEITESAITSGSEYLAMEIRKFRDAGYEVWMDDFGSGYSSLNNLKNYDFDLLKIDMAFLRAFESNKKSRVILASIVNMAKELGIHTVAEGVETQEQYDFLKSIGCEKLQGYLFSKPTPSKELQDQGVFEKEHEDFEYHDYFEQIGKLNFLSNTPLRPKNLEVIINVPLCITECEKENVRMVYANDEYLSFLDSLGIKSLQEANKRLEIHDISEAIKLRALLDEAYNAEDHRAYTDVTINGFVGSLKARFLAEKSDKRAYAVVGRNASLRTDKDMSESLYVAMTHVMSQYFRVDLFDENGTVENVFLSGKQEHVADIESNTVKACRIYAESYLHPDDRDDFCKFYDMTTVRKRCKDKKREYIVNYFRSCIPGEEGRLQMYLIMPFYYNNKWKYISCCRYVDEVRKKY